MQSLRFWLLSSFLLSYACTATALDSVIAPRAVKSLALDVVATSPSQHVAVGERGHVLISTDLGLTWQQKVVPTRATLTSVAEANGNLVVGGHDGVLLLSTDQGETWKLVRDEPDQEKPVLDILFVDDKTGYAVGAYGLFLKTTDGGYRWIEQTKPELEIPEFGFPHFYQMLRMKDSSLLLVGEAGFIARSEDSGDTWNTVELPYEGTLFAVTQTSSGALVVAGMRGNVFRSEDAGKTWQDIQIDIRSGLNHIIYENEKLVITGMDGVMLSSTDDGKTFSIEQRPNRKAIAASTLINGDTLLVAAEDGVHRLPVPGSAK